MKSASAPPSFPAPADTEAAAIEPTWARAEDLSERLASLRRAGGAPSVDPGLVDRHLAARRLERWRGKAPFADDDALWQRRLAADRITDRELTVLLGESEAAIAARCDGVPRWRRVIEAAYQEEIATPLDWPEAPAEAEPGEKPTPFAALAEPLVRHLLPGLTEALDEIRGRHPEAPFDTAGAVRILLHHARFLLGSSLTRVLVVELHAARLEERLEGDTPEERFADFVSSLRHRETAFELFDAYPVLARQLVQTLEQWREIGVEFFSRLAADAGALRERFFAGELGRLVEARGGVSDPHRGGRGVFLLRFEGGRRLVYKPRSLAVEAAFQLLLDHLGRLGFDPAPRTLEVLDRGSHGWVEFVAPAPCPDLDALRRFYLRQGAYAGLLHLLDGTDVHHENLIAAGEHPVLVDLETLFHPWIDGPSLHDAADLPGASLRESPMRSGLLPQSVWGDRDRAGVDISALGAEDGQLTPQKVLVPTGRDTEAMRFERRQVEIPLADNRPRIEGETPSIVELRAQIEEGFERMLRFCAAHREALLAADGPLEAFADVETRVLFRPTAGYGNLLLEAEHPHARSNALERTFLFDRLWADVSRRPFLEPLIPAEIADLSAGDVPCFMGRPGSRDLWTSRGERLEGFFGETGLQRVRRRLAEEVDDALPRQMATVRTSLEVVRLRRARTERPAYELTERERPASRDELLAAAREIGEELVATAFVSPSEAVWTSIDHAEPAGWTLSITGPDVYAGVPGIALFLGHLGAVTGDGSFTATARRALVAQRRQIDQDPARLPGLGLFNGWGGPIWAATHLGALWRDDELLDEAEALLDRLPAVADDRLLDVIAGSAGLLTALLALDRHRPSARLRALARACGDRLLETAEPQPAGGVGWRMPLAGDRALAGISHGAAGIGLALLRLTAVTGDPRYRDAALEGFAFERALFDADEGTWPDLRLDAEALEAGLDHAHERFLCAWCHGAPGIGLARLAGLPYLDDAEVREEIALAVAATLANGFGKNHGLCHGDLGNLDFLHQAARALGDRSLLERVGRLAAGILHSLATRGRVHGLQGNAPTPGLMVGAAGIGYGLLRLAEPERVPCLLALDAPGAEHLSRVTFPPWAETATEPAAGGSAVLHESGRT